MVVGEKWRGGQRGNFRKRKVSECQETRGGKMEGPRGKGKIGK